METLEEYKEERMRDPDFAREYAVLEPWRDRVRKEAGEKKEKSEKKR